MAKNVLFLVHGMGTHRDASAGAAAWHLEAARALHDAWSQFPSLASRPFESYIELVPLSYDGVFREYLSGVSDAAERVRSALGELQYAKVASVIEDAEPDETSFFWANAADVLLYRFGGDLYRNVHMVLGHQIAQRVRKAWDNALAGPTQFSILSHSLGTATIHGALNRLGGGRIAGSDALRLGGNFGLHCYVTLANVSRLLYRGRGSLYNQTIVRPRRGGPQYVRRFINVRHVADPVAAPLCFAPRRWGAGYSEISVRHLRDANVHGFAHYLAHPRVGGGILRALLPSVLLSQAEVDAVAAEFRDVDVDSPEQRLAAEQAIGDVARSLRAAYAGDRNVISGSVEWIARMLRDVWRHRQLLGAAWDALT